MFLPGPRCVPDYFILIHNIEKTMFGWEGQIRGLHVGQWGARNDVDPNDDSIK